MAAAAGLAAQLLSPLLALLAIAGEAESSPQQHTADPRRRKPR